MAEVIQEALALPCLMFLRFKWQRTQDAEGALWREPKCGESGSSVWVTERMLCPDMKILQMATGQNYTKRITDTLQLFKMESLELIFKRKHGESGQPPSGKGFLSFLLHSNNPRWDSIAEGPQRKAGLLTYTYLQTLCTARHLKQNKSPGGLSDWHHDQLPRSAGAHINWGRGGIQFLKDFTTFHYYLRFHTADSQGKKKKILFCTYNNYKLLFCI